MLDKYVICDNGLENCFQSGEKIGYRIKIGIPYYRSVPLSCIEEITLMVDNYDVAPDSIMLEIGSSKYLLEEMSDKMDIWWDFLEKGYLVVKSSGGLTQGKHKIKVHFIIRIPYLIPVDDGFVPNYDVSNAVKLMEVIA